MHHVGHVSLEKGLGARVEGWLVPLQLPTKLEQPTGQTRGGAQTLAEPLSPRGRHKAVTGVPGQGQILKVSHARKHPVILGKTRAPRMIGHNGYAIVPEQLLAQQFQR